MNAILKGVKETVERIGGCRIYRYTLPHGTDCYIDIARRFGREGIKVVFDVGANVGQSAVQYVREFPRAEIYSFEPVASTYRELVAATGRISRIHAYELGMGSEAGEATINVNNANPSRTASSIKLRRPGDQQETIVVDTIAGFAEKNEIVTIDFLKVDTEGYDLEVLAGAAPLLGEQRVHFILSECEPVVRTKRFADFRELAGFMAGFGYEIFGVYEQQPEWDGRNVLLYWNALFISERLVAQGARLPCA